jgi:hypothetical protein
MATTKKPSKSFRKKVLRIVEGDTLKSIAAASVLLNILFLVSIFVVTSTDTFDRRFYNAARSQYCKNVSGIKARAKELGDEKKAIREWELTCVSSNFRPYYDEAVEKFDANRRN